MVRQTRLRTGSDLSNSNSNSNTTSNSLGPPQSTPNLSPSYYLNNFDVGDRIPGFRTSAGKQSSLPLLHCINGDYTSGMKHLHFLPEVAMRAQSLHPSPHHPQRLQANPVHPTAFFTSLRANLHLTETTDPFLSLSPSSTDMSSSSAASTPPSLPTNPSSSSPLATATIPDLTTAPTATPASRLAALHLVADSVAQQRQSASRALIFHPLVLAAFVAVLALVAQLLYESRGDLALVATTWAGLVMAGLVGVRWAVSEYIEVAEGIGWRWLEDGGKLEGEGEDVVVVSWWGEEVIGALVVRLVREEHGSAGGAGAGAGAGGGKAGRRSRAGKGTYTAYIRAWTVKLRFRGKGVGTGLLEEAVRICHERGVDALEFAADHANSARVLPSIFNGGFERREARARKMLDEVVRAQGGLGGRKR